MKSLASLNPKLIYYHASGDLPETVEMELRDASGRYVTTAVMQAQLLLSDVRVFPCGDGDDVKLDPLQYIAVLDFLEKSRERLRSKETVKTLSGWRSSGLNFEDYFSPGDKVTGDVVDDLVNALPPTLLWSSCTQIGEPFSHENNGTGQYLPTYVTFSRIPEEDGLWKFCGYCFKSITRNAVEHPSRLELRAMDARKEIGI